MLRLLQKRAIATTAEYGSRPIRKVMAANRAEIAIRIFRAAQELGKRTVAIYSKEDFTEPHRGKADEAFVVGEGESPVGAYLHIPSIIQVAKEHSVDAIHPGYGFLSEKPEFVRAMESAGILFLGPTADAMDDLGSKTAARQLATKYNVPVVPGTNHALTSADEAKQFAEKIGYPIILKASFGGGGRGMRVVWDAAELESSLERATSEAKASFGDGAMFMEKYLQNPRHIEIQLIGDGKGGVVHLFERDCSVQRRHQKLVEIAPAPNLDPKIREACCADAIKLCKAVNYRSAGTAEFLVDSKTGQHYFIEVNPRLQVEHTVTEEITGIDIVQSQIQLAEGASLADLGLTQDKISFRGCAIQARVTTEDPEADFRPATGRIEFFRPGEGIGIRLDGSSGFVGANISPYYDSLLVKVTARAQTHEQTCRRLTRALTEFRVRGVTTNIPFLTNVLGNAEFRTGFVGTSFIEANKDLFKLSKSKNRAGKIMRYLAEISVNGPQTPLGTPDKPSRVDPSPPVVPEGKKGWRDIYVAQGPDAFAKAIRAHKGLLITDTSFRDAHQSLLATRVRTRDILKVSKFAAHAFENCYSLENWGGATFDVALRFLKECPWDRLRLMRQLVPHIPFQMLLRGANAVGYTSYPDNAVYKFCEISVREGMDVFRVFDSLNYMPNLILGMDAVHKAGGIVEGAICYSGDISDPSRQKYSLDYYLKLVRDMVKSKVMHVLCIKDMAGVLKPNAAKMLVGAIRKEFPDLPIHLHMHDTAGAGVASYLAAAEAGVDAVDVACDSMSGTTSQPSMGAVVAALKGTPLDTGISLPNASTFSDYWEQARSLYAPFEATATIKSGSADVYDHEIPGGQYTNMHFQAFSLGLAHEWPAIKKAYSDANMLLGDIVKVTPSSKVVGDLAQFMVTNKLNKDAVVDRAESLSFPSSVVEFFEGLIGQPYGGFPEPLRSRVLKNRKDVLRLEGRPGESLPPTDFAKLTEQLQHKYNKTLTDADVMSAIMYPKVYEEFQESLELYGDGLPRLPTWAYLCGLDVGESFSLQMEKGKDFHFRLNAKGDVNKANGMVEVFFELNGQPRTIIVQSKAAAATMVSREKAKKEEAGSIGAPMPGSIVSVKVKEGQVVKKGETLAVMSAMKMETAVNSPIDGTVKVVTCKTGDVLAAGDLIVLVA